MSLDSAASIFKYPGVDMRRHHCVGDAISYRCPRQSQGLRQIGGAVINFETSGRSAAQRAPVGNAGQSIRESGSLLLPISRPAVSRHLRLLKESGLVEEEPHGTRRIYRLQEEGMLAVQTYLQQVWGDAAARFRIAAENLPSKSRS